MNNLDYEFSPQLQKLVDMGESGLDIIHGELKNLMLKAEDHYDHWCKIEEKTGYDDAMDSMERKYWEGQLDALTTVYQLTYDLSFAINERIKTNG
jgi:hypothetical protein